MIDDFERKLDQWDIWIEHIDVDDELKDVFHELVEEHKRHREQLSNPLERVNHARPVLQSLPHEQEML